MRILHIETQLRVRRWYAAWLHSARNGTAEVMEACITTSKKLAGFNVEYKRTAENIKRNRPRQDQCETSARITAASALVARCHYGIAISRSHQSALIGLDETWIEYWALMVGLGSKVVINNMLMNQAPYTIVASQWFRFGGIPVFQSMLHSQ